MDATKELRKIIDSINMSDEQGQALNEYIVNYLDDWKKKVEEKVFEEVNRYLLEQYNEKAQKYETQLRDTLTVELTETLTASISEKVVTETKAQSKEDFDKAIATLNEYFGSQYKVFCAEAVKEIEKTLREDQEALPELKAFNSIVGVLQPFVEMKDSMRHIEIMNKQDQTIRELTGRLVKESKDKAIAELVAYLPESQQETMRNFLSEAETPEDVCDKYEQGLKFIKSVAESLDVPTARQGINAVRTSSQRPDFVNKVESAQRKPVADDKFTGIRENKNSKAQDSFREPEPVSVTPVNEGANGQQDEGDVEPQNKLNRMQQKVRHLAGDDLPVV